MIRVLLRSRRQHAFDTNTSARCGPPTGGQSETLPKQQRPFEPIQGRVEREPVAPSAQILEIAVGPGFRGSRKATAVSLEFGTSPALTVVPALRAENWLHHHGGKGHPDAGRIKAELLRAFYPDADEWKVRVWNQGKEVVEQVLAYMNEK